jgi:hypothetical protein
LSERRVVLPRSTDKHTEASVTVPVWIRQSSLDGICDLIAWCDGFRDAKGGTIPGAFELVMHYRTLISCINDALNNEKIKQEEDI